MKWFDYVFYRAATFFYERDGADADRAIWLVTGMQAFSILNLYLTCMFFAFEDHGKRFKQVGAIVWIAFLCVSYALNRWRYNGRYEDHKGRFEEGQTRKTMKGVLIVIIMIFLFWYPVFFLHFFGTSFTQHLIP